MNVKINQWTEDLTNYSKSREVVNHSRVPTIHQLNAVHKNTNKQ